MNNKSEPTTEGASLDDFIASFTQENVPESDPELKAGDTPVFLAVLYFLDGFNRSYFDDMYQCMLQGDPILGANTFGQLA